MKITASQLYYICKVYPEIIDANDTEEFDKLPEEDRHYWIASANVVNKLGGNMKIEIEELKKVKLDKDDTLLMTFDEGNLSAEEIETSLKVLKECFPKNKVICYPSNISMEVIKACV